MAVTIKQRGTYGPYYFAVDTSTPGGGSASSTPSPSGFADAPTITADTPSSVGGYAAQALGAPSTGIGGRASSFAANLGTNALLGLAGIPSMATTMPINGLLALSHLARRGGLEGQDPSGLTGLTQQGVEQGMNVQGNSLGHAIALALSQSGHLPGTLDQQIAQNLAALGPRGVDPNDAGVTTSDAPGPGIGISGGIGGSGDTSNAEDRGGYIGRKPRPKADTRGHVRVTALPTEYIVNPKATALHRTVLDAINQGATRGDLARILKAGR